MVAVVKEDLRLKTTYENGQRGGAAHRLVVTEFSVTLDVAGVAGKKQDVRIKGRANIPGSKSLLSQLGKTRGNFQ